jgi:hypothetical protein
MNGVAAFEHQRLVSLEHREGKTGALDFAKKTLQLYRKSLSQRNANGKRTGYGLAFRDNLVLSCLIFRKYLRTNRQAPDSGAC